MLADGLLAVVVLVGGYNIMLRPYLGATYAGAREFLPRLVLGGILINTAAWWCRLAIDANNAACAAFGTPSLGEVVSAVPIGLASVGIGAILALAGGATLNAANTVESAAQGPGDQTSPRASLPPEAAVVTPIPSGMMAGHGLIAGWSARGPLDQYARANYRSEQSWLEWRNADCSAAALGWLLGAYGQQLGSLDDAIALVGPGTGISTRLGLLDARGPALVRALAARGLRPRQPRRSDGQLAPLGSITELKAWLDQGPLLMDGARWFGEGHWFVGIGHDAGGIFIRDSSGWDTRYLSWSRLYGEVGFSGWVVGVVA